METFLAQIAALFSAPPGNLAYHLVLAFCIAGALSASLFQAPLTPNRPTQRLHLGLAALLAVQVLLFLVNGLIWQRSAFIQILLPAADRAVSLLNLGALAWLWLYPFFLRREKMLAAWTGLGTVFLCAVTVALTPLPRRLPFNLSWLDFAWQSGMLVVCLLLIWLASRRRPPGWELGAVMFGLIGIGHLVQLLFPLPDGDFPGLARLADLAAYPFLFALPGRPLFSNQSETRPNPFAQNRRRHSTDPSTLKALIGLASSAHATPDPATVARAIAHALIADCCYLVAPYDPAGQITLLGGYDLIQDAALPGLTIDALKTPSLAAALRQGQALLETNPPGDLEPNQVIASAAHLTRTGSLFFLPFTPAPDDPKGGLLLLSPYSNREWTAEDQAYLAPALTEIAHLVLNRTEMLPSADDETPQARDAEALQLNEVLSLQQELQETVERLQEENELLRSAAVSHGFDQTSILRGGFHDGSSSASPTPDEIGMHQPMPQREFLKLVDTIIFQMRQSVAASAGFSDLLEGSAHPIRKDEYPVSGRLRHSIEKTRFLLDGLSRLVTLQYSPELSAAEWVRLPELVDQGLGFIRTQLEQKNLALRLDIPEDLPAFQADDPALRQVLVHLLQNAVTVTPPHGVVTIRARIQAEEALSPILVLQITDMGGGISPRDLYRVFSPPSGDPEVAISGVAEERMGLQVARSLVQALGGRIWIEPGDGGSTFSILLPIACAAPTLAHFGS